MTSDLVAKAPKGASDQRKLLSTVLTGYCVSLKKLRPEEFDDVLYQALSRLSLDRLRGFTALRQTIASGGDYPEACDEDTIFNAYGFEDHPLSMDTQTQRLCDGVISQELIYREHETGQETTDWSTAQEWGQHNMDIVRGHQTFILLARFPKLRQAERSLVLVTTHFEKVPRKKRYRIKRIEARRLLVQNFRETLGDKAPQVANNMISRICSILSRTISAMRGEVESLAHDERQWDNLNKTIIE